MPKTFHRAGWAGRSLRTTGWTESRFCRASVHQLPKIPNNPIGRFLLPTTVVWVGCRPRVGLSFWIKPADFAGEEKDAAEVSVRTPRRFRLLSPVESFRF